MWAFPIRRESFSEKESASFLLTSRAADWAESASSVMKEAFYC